MLLFHFSIIFDNAQADLNHQKVDAVFPEFLVILSGSIEYTVNSIIIKACKFAIDCNESRIIYGLFDFWQQLIEI